MSKQQHSGRSHLVTTYYDVTLASTNHTLANRRRMN